MKIKYLLLAFFIGLGIYLRFVHIGDLLYFNMDEERDAFIVKRILVNRHFTLIGGSVPGGIYIGPGLYYLSSLPFLISKLNPLGLGVFASILGVISIILIYIIGRKLFSERVGLISAGLFSSSYLMVIYNRHFWPLTPAPICAMLVIYSLFKIIKKNYSYCYLLSISLIVGLQSDPSNVTLLLLTLAVFWLYKLAYKKKEVLISVFLLIFSHLPLVLFDFRHNFLNSRAFIKLLAFKSPKTSSFDLEGISKILTLFPQTLSRIIYTFGDLDVSKQLTPCFKYENLRNKSIPLMLLLISLVILIYWLGTGFIKAKNYNNKNIGLRLIGIHIAITFFSIFLFYLVVPSYVREYFLSALFPGFIFLLALSFESLWKKGLKIPVIILLAILILVNSRAVIKAKNFLGFSNKIKTVNFVINKIGNRPFFLDSLSTCFKYNGIRYLFYFAGKEPDKSFMDSHYTWLYDKQPVEKEPRFGAVLVSLDEQETEEFNDLYYQYRQKTIDRQRFGGIEVLIVDNEKK